MTKPRLRTFDVRPIIARGQSPFDQIVAALGALPAGDTLVVITPFLPSPLIEKLQADGFTARPERRADGTWQTQFEKS